VEREHRLEAGTLSRDRAIVAGMDAPPRTILRESRDADGLRHLDARLAADGDLVIEGQDLGDGVERFHGPGIREYEWIWTVRAKELPALVAALGGQPGEGVLGLLERRFAGEAAAGLRAFLDGSGIAVESWSRLGD
jgi:hypothetical protein